MDGTLKKYSDNGGAFLFFEDHPERGFLWTYRVPFQWQAFIPYLVHFVPVFLSVWKRLKELGSIWNVCYIAACFSGPRGKRSLEKDLSVWGAWRPILAFTVQRHIFRWTCGGRLTGRCCKRACVLSQRTLFKVKWITVIIYSVFFLGSFHSTPIPENCSTPVGQPPWLCFNSERFHISLFHVFMYPDGHFDFTETVRRELHADT